MNTRKTAPIVGIVSLVALLTGGAGAAQARVIANDGPPAIQSVTQGLSFDRVESIRSAKQAESGVTAKQGVSFDRAESIRSAKQAESGVTAKQGVSFDRAESIRSAKQAEARAQSTETVAGDTVDDDLSPARGGR